MHCTAALGGIVACMPTDSTPDRPAPGPRGLRVRYEAGLLARASFDAAQSLPRGARGDLADQIRRAATSVYANLAEGEGRATTLDRLRCFTIAWGSLRELDALLDLAEYVSSPDGQHAARARSHARHVGRMLASLRHKLASPESNASPPAPHQQPPPDSAPPTAAL